ncbi:hypothetical protein ACQ8YR_002629 [Yersinia enterocolitica]
MELGETSETAAKPEIQEEISAAITDMSLLGVRKNISKAGNYTISFTVSLAVIFV